MIPRRPLPRLRWLPPRYLTGRGISISATPTCHPRQVTRAAHHATMRPRAPTATCLGQRPSRALFSTSPSLAKDKDKDKDKGFFDTAADIPPEEEPAANKTRDDKADKADKAVAEETTTSIEDGGSGPADSPSAVEGSAGSKQDLELADAKVGAAEVGGTSPAVGSAQGSAQGSASESASGSGSGPGSGSSSNDGPADGGRKPQKTLVKASVPEIYPQALAVAISKRPLFPGWYKTINILDPNMAAAIADMCTKGQPYLAVFMHKDENANQDIVRDPRDVYDVGVFAQITSYFPLGPLRSAGLTAVVYPHRRIRMTSLVHPKGDDLSKPSTASEADPRPIPTKTKAKDVESSQKGDVVASFEESAVPPKPEESEPAAKAIYEPLSFLRKFPVSLANIENLTDEEFDPRNKTIRGIAAEIVATFREIANFNMLFRDQVATFSASLTGNIATEPEKLADFAAVCSHTDPEELQEILATMNVEERLNKALAAIKKELETVKIQNKIKEDVDTRVTKRQREYYLTEQLKTIKHELGLDLDGREKLIGKFKQKADALTMPEAVRQVFDEELSKLSTLETAASEYNVIRNYLDWLTQIPWGQQSVENFDIKHATAVLDQDHYGLKDVKDRILEFIAVGKLRGTVEGKILCFVGPPGVGKTSIAKSIARALNREYYRFSVGGLSDVAEIKGHRRTYVGALPGRVIQAFKKTKTENPLILIDEIDKLGKGWQGDPASALLELLDPEQNFSFLDHYMDLPVDLSKVLFVCTANLTDTIPTPLLDRMEVIRLSGYITEEKKAIAERYLAPQAQKLAGLQDRNVKITDDAIAELIKSYCREAGVRNLKGHIEKVYRKAAFKVVQDLGEAALPESEALTDQAVAASKEAEREAKDKSDTDVKASSEFGSESGSDDSQTTASRDTSTAPSSVSLTDQPVKPSDTAVNQPRKPLEVPTSVRIVVGNDDLKDYVGPPIYTSDRLYDVMPAGVALGLAWTQMGGSALYVESILQSVLRSSSRPGLELTGNLQKVMKESSAIAYSFAQSFMVKEFPRNDFFEKAKIHKHFPEGAIPKDGPSAGVTMTSSLLSLALDTPIDPAIAMTGELTLTGKVLRIGGLKEKTVAAKRAGCRMVIFPDVNMADWLDLDENVRAGIEGRPVAWYSDVFDTVFPNIDREKANRSRVIEDEKKPPDGAKADKQGGDE